MTDKILKICHITSVHPRYDIRIFVKECQTLAKIGANASEHIAKINCEYDVSLIVADELADEIKDHIKIYSVGKSISRKQRILVTCRKIYNKVLELNPDVVHFHDPELMLVGLKLLKHGIKVIYDVHEDVPKQVLNKTWLPKVTRAGLAWVIKLFEGYCARKFSGIITATPLIEKRFKLYNSNTVAICNYPLLSELNIIQSSITDNITQIDQAKQIKQTNSSGQTSKESNWSNRENKICYIGSISEARGIIPLVNSLAISKLTLELAGQFSDDVSLKKLQLLEGGKYINYLGIVNRVEIVKLLQRIKIGVVTLLPTSSYIESLPIKMFEYMLASIPVIASNFPLWDSIITKYDCGVLVEPTDSEAIAKACESLLNNPERSQQMGDNGRNAVIKYFNWEAQASKLIKFYSYI